MATDIHITEKPYQEGDQTPQILIGFTGPGFSQAVFIDAPQDAGEAVQHADFIYKAFIEACGKAVKAWKERLSDDESAT